MSCRSVWVGSNEELEIPGVTWSFKLVDVAIWPVAKSCFNIPGVFPASCDIISVTLALPMTCWMIFTRCVAFSLLIHPFHVLLLLQNNFCHVCCGHCFDGLYFKNKNLLALLSHECKGESNETFLNEKGENNDVNNSNWCSMWKWKEIEN